MNTRKKIEKAALAVSMATGRHRFWSAPPPQAKPRPRRDSDATFKEADLITLKDTISGAINLVASQPPEWDVYVGDHCHYNAGQQFIRDPMYTKVSNEAFSDLLKKFARLIERAVKENGSVVCIGD